MPPTPDGVCVTQGSVWSPDASGCHAEHDRRTSEILYDCHETHAAQATRKCSRTSGQYEGPNGTMLNKRYQAS